MIRTATAIGTFKSGESAVGLNNGVAIRATLPGLDGKKGMKGPARRRKSLTACQ